ncbi:MAG TPA: PilN domain-containing protein [Stellaceae bacterium]|jgi:general secretion pathway protein L|nr:PilN domain-containing protein [Stellaceae bacterium]
MSIASDRPLKTPRASAWPSRALRWWLGELRAAWDDAVRRLQAGGAAITIEAGERYWVLRRKQRPIGHIDRHSYEHDECQQMLADAVAAAGAGAVLIEIPPERVLSKLVTYPSSARGELDRIVEFDFSRHFPFPAERVLYRHRIVPRTGAGAVGETGTLAVEIVAVPREVVAEICGELAAAGLSPAGIGLVGATSAEPLFLPGSAIPQRRRAASRLNRSLVYAVPAMAVAALVSWPAAQQARLAALERDIAELKPRAEVALKQRERQQQETERLRAILALQGARPPLVRVLDMLSRDLPDGAWLLSLSVSGRDMVMDGLSPSAAEIALALQKSGAFKDIVFRAPVTREAASGLERFQLGAAVVEAKP